MHMFQKHILDTLRHHESARYSDIQPDGVESSHFKYHLDQLIKGTFVEKQSRGVYCLTVSGQALVDRLSEGVVIPEQTPKVITYTLLQDPSCYYLQRKQKAPYRDLLTMVSGKVHIGEDTATAAIREVYEKTRAVIVQPTLQSVIEMKIVQDSQLLTHAVIYVYTSDIDYDQLTFKHVLAVPRKQLAERTDLAPDLMYIIDTLNRDKVIVSSKTITL